MSMARYGIGIIGTGWVAGAHIETFRKIPGCEFVAVCSRDQRRAQAYIDQMNLGDAGAYDNLKDFLAHPGLDIVCIATPHPEHPAQVIAAAKAGKHILIEKPVALNARDLGKMVAAVNAAGVKTSVCFELHWNGMFRNMKAMLDQKLIGNVFYGESSYYHGIGPWYGQWKWNIKEDMAGSAELTAGCHALDGLIWLMGSRVVEVAAMSNTSPNNPLKYEYDPNGVAILRFENGAIGKVGTSVECRMPYTFPVMLQGEKGALYNDKISLTQWPGTRGWATVPSALPDSGDVHDHPYQGQFEHFIDSINKGKSPENDLNYAAHTHEVCFAIQQANKTRKTVKVKRTPGT
jgi:predicted dehydrogenase